MSLIRRKPAEKPIYTLIPLAKAAEMLDLSKGAIRLGKAGTAHLTKVRQGTGKRQRISLIREEVEAHIESLVQFARAHNPANANAAVDGDGRKKGGRK